MWWWEFIPLPAAHRPYDPLNQGSVSQRGLWFWRAPSYKSAFSLCLGRGDGDGGG